MTAVVEGAIPPSPPRRIAVLGATGYVGARLVPRLLAAGHSVVAMSRSASDIDRWPWGSDVDTHDVDFLAEPAAGSAPLFSAPLFADVDVVVHLVHSMTDNGEFSDLDRTIAERVAAEAAAAEVDRIVYLSGLGVDPKDRAHTRRGRRPQPNDRDEPAELSDHLASRHEVGRVLAATGVPTIELRAALLLGSASASFEMLRAVGDLGPVLPVPRSVTSTRVQPIAIDDALDDLLWAATVAAPVDTVIDIGGPDAMTYAELIARYRRVAHDSTLRTLPIPFVPNRVAAIALSVLSPLPRPLVASLVDSITHDVVVRPSAAMERHRPDLQRVSVDDALRRAIEADDELLALSHWSDDVVAALPEASYEVDPDWAGPVEYEDRRSVITEVAPEAIFAVLTGLGGRSGWLVGQPLWELRGMADKLLFGGVGLRRGRRHRTNLVVGDVLDWWRVEAIEPPNRLLLRAEMVMPGDGWLEWTVTEEPGDARATRVVQRAVFRPRGVLGRPYWWFLLPFHLFLFPRLVARVIERAGRLGPIDGQNAGAGAATRIGGDFEILETQ